MAREHPEEAWARRVVAAHLGVAVAMHDDNSAEGMYDLRVGPVHAPTHAIEVTTAVDKQWLETWHAGKRRPRFPDLVGDWLLYIRPTANIRKLEREFPSIARTAVDRGVSQLIEGGGTHRDLCGATASLGVIFATRQPGTGTGEVSFAMDSRGGRPAVEPIDWTGKEFVEWVSTFISAECRSDNLRKLDQSGAPQRELFIAVDEAGVPPSAAGYVNGLTKYFRVPETEPVLPEPLTGLWITSLAQIRRTPGLRWADSQWTTFDPSV